MTTSTVDMNTNKHPLLAREIRPLRSWNEWLERWEQAVAVEELLGLLHVGFNVRLTSYKQAEPMFTSADRLIFYFEIANGWTDWRLLYQEDDHNRTYVFGQDGYGCDKYISLKQFRQLVAKKAFDTLAANLFKTKFEDYMFHNDVWEREIVAEPLFEAIQAFFRIESDGLTNISPKPWNNNRSHHERIAISFLCNLATFIWEWTPNDRGLKEKDSERIRKRLAAAKPWMLDVLSHLGELNVVRKWLTRFDKPELAKLEEIALRTKIHCYNYPESLDRQAMTIDEACYGESPAAWLLKEHELKRQEYLRFTDILRVEQRKKVLERELEKLTGTQS